MNVEMLNDQVCKTIIAALLVIKEKLATMGIHKYDFSIGLRDGCQVVIRISFSLPLRDSAQDKQFGHKLVLPLANFVIYDEPLDIRLDQFFRQIQDAIDGSVQEISVKQ